MSVKSTLKRILPISVFERIKRIANGGLSLYGMTLTQAHRFNKAYAKYDSTGICQIAARMTFSLIKSKKVSAILIFDMDSGISLFSI